MFLALAFLRPRGSFVKDVTNVIAVRRVSNSVQISINIRGSTQVRNLMNAKNVGKASVRVLLSLNTRGHTQVRNHMPACSVGNASDRAHI